MIDLKAIRAAAEAAPKSRFRVCHNSGPFYSLIGDGDYFHGRVRGKERANFIATANPAAFLELLDRLEAAEKDAARYRWIRHGDNDESILCGDCRGIYLPRNERLDEAIDHWLELERMTVYLTQDHVMHGAAMKDEQK